MSEPQIEQRPAQPYLGIAGRITDGVPAFVDKAFPELFRWLGEHDIEPSGPPFIRFRELDTDGEPLEIEVAAPVDDEAQGDERVSAGTLPAGRYLTLIHRGPYRSESAPDLAVARYRLISFAATQRNRPQPRNPYRHHAPLRGRALPDRPGRGARLHEVGNRVRLLGPRRVSDGF